MKKISDILIISACIIIVGLFFIDGISGFGGGSVKADAASASNTPSPTAILQVTATPTPTPVTTQTAVATPTPFLERIDASYTGPSVIVGKEYDKSMIIVTATYSNGAQENITDFNVSSDFVQTTGMNTIIVLYRDLSTKVYIYGRRLEHISVSPRKLEYGIGNMPDCKDLRVVGVYSDGSVEEIEDNFDIYPDVIDKEGNVEVTVTYQGKQASCNVFGKKWDQLVALSVSYNKPNAITNVKLDRNDITVMAVYSDLSSERITTYAIEKDLYVDSGKQLLTVVYGGIRKQTEISVIERYIVGVSAEYTGGEVVVGRTFRKADMHVYLEYVDGAKEETEDYTVHTRKIRYIGNNVISVYYGDKFSDTVIIEGIELREPDFSYVSRGTASNGNVSIKVSTAIPQYLDENAIEIKGLKNSTVKKAYKKLKLRSGTYIAFTYDFANPDEETELPLNVRITIPAGFDIEHTFLYYTPNRKTILGRTNKKIIDDNTFECTLFRTGTYILVYSDQLVEDAVEE